jgi:3-dehydroquinate synthase
MTASVGRLASIAHGGELPYDVIIGHGLAGQVPGLVPGAGVVAVVRPEVLADVATPIVDALASAGHETRVITIPPGEAAKSLTAVAALWDAFAEAGVGRRDAVVAVGGGATTDVTGFAAATWLRGVRVVHVPTTLLAIVDAAIGGKTGINTVAGKNLVGAFHNPSGVVVDLTTLSTLPVDEWVNGMAEVVKAGFIADPTILDLVEADPDGARRPDGPHSRELIERSILVKTDVVSQDLREAGLREALNYGHTLGHAIELVEEFRLPHGHAVSIGLVYAAGLSRTTVGLSDDVVARHRTILDGLGLPTRFRPEAWDQLLAAMQRDKKVRAGRVRFVVLEGVGKPVVVDAPEASVLESVYAEVTR